MAILYVGVFLEKSANLCQCPLVYWIAIGYHIGVGSSSSARKRNAPASARNTPGARASLTWRLAVMIVFDSTHIVKPDAFGFGIDESDYDLLAGEAAALDALTNGHFLG